MLWIGTYHGSHSGDRVVVTTSRDDAQPMLPYGLECTCGLSERYTDSLRLDRSAWRHTHPTRWDRARQWLRGHRRNRQPAKAT